MSGFLRLQHNPARVVESVRRWIDQALCAGGVNEEQAKAWSAALKTVQPELAALEAATPSDRLNASSAEWIVQEATKSVELLARLAADAATKAELRQIEAHAMGLLSALEALSTGVARPQPSQQQGA